MVSVDFAEVERLQVSGEWDRAGALLAAEAGRLEKAGADFLVLCTNTMHKVADAIEQAVGIPLLHLGDVTAAAVLAEGVGTVGLLGTGFTMSRTSTAAGWSPTGSACSCRRRSTGRSCTASSTTSSASESSARSRVRPTSRWSTDSSPTGREGVILGCTEIELLIGPDDLSVPSFPTTRLHVEAAVDRALDGGARERTGATWPEPCSSPTGPTWRAT